MTLFFVLLGEHDGYVHLTTKGLDDPKVASASTVAVVEKHDKAHVTVTVNGRKRSAMVTASDKNDMVLWCFPEPKK